MIITIGRVDFAEVSKEAIALLKQQKMENTNKHITAVTRYWELRRGLAEVFLNTL